MSQGKYSPSIGFDKRSCQDFIFNSYGKEAKQLLVGEEYDVKIHFGDFDSEGFDSYGYSCWYLDGTWAGVGGGVDRYGVTENEYMSMTPEQFGEFL